MTLRAPITWLLTLASLCLVASIAHAKVPEDAFITMSMARQLVYGVKDSKVVVLGNTAYDYPEGLNFLRAAISFEESRAGEWAYIAIEDLPTTLQPQLWALTDDSLIDDLLVSIEAHYGRKHYNETLVAYRSLFEDVAYLNRMRALHQVSPIAIVALNGTPSDFVTTLKMTSSKFQKRGVVLATAPNASKQNFPLPQITKTNLSLVSDIPTLGSLLVAEVGDEAVQSAWLSVEMLPADRANYVPRDFRAYFDWAHGLHSLPFMIHSQTPELWADESKLTNARKQANLRLTTRTDFIIGLDSQMHRHTRCEELFNVRKWLSGLRVQVGR